MKLERLFASVAFAVTMVVGGGASAAPILANVVGSTVGVASPITADGSGNIAGMTSALIGANGAVISGIEAGGNPNGLSDNLFSGAGNPALGNAVDLFSSRLVPNAWEYNLYSVGMASYLSSYSPDAGQSNVRDPGTLSAIAVSEPATWGMMLLGVGLMAAGLRMMFVKRSGAPDEEGLYIT
jgi:hypothetical protein